MIRKWSKKAQSKSPPPNFDLIEKFQEREKIQKYVDPHHTHTHIGHMWECVCIFLVAWLSTSVRWKRRNVVLLLLVRSRGSFYKKEWRLQRLTHAQTMDVELTDGRTLAVTLFFFPSHKGFPSFSWDMNSSSLSEVRLYIRPLLFLSLSQRLVQALLRSNNNSFKKIKGARALYIYSFLLFM